ncbi:MAG: hypothetical protein AB7V46_25585 [Thermomicrobiales bacterium]
MLKISTKSNSRRAAEPGKASHLVLHREHKRWMSENTMWRQDIAAWQRELKQARADLAEIEKALQTHAAAIRCYEQNMAEHEHALAEFERGQSGDKLLAMSASHEKEAKKHYQQRQAHERVKSYQHKLVGHCQALCKVISSM